MAEYSYKDIITGKDIITDQVKDSDIIGAKGYFTNDLQDIVDSLDYDSSIDALPKGTLETVTYSGRFKRKEDKEYYEYFILKKESVKKYVPFDLSDSEVRKSLRGKWIKNKDNHFEICITDFSHQGHVGNTIRADIYRANGMEADELLNYWMFDDGTPCGRLVEE